MKENLDPKLAELLKDVNETYQVLAETSRSYLYCEALMPAVYTARMFGEGGDVSPWEMALEDIHGLMTDRLIRRSVDIWDNSKSCSETLEEFCRHLDSAKPKVSAGRGTWCLEYLIWSAFHKHPNLDEKQKESLRELYGQVWEVVSSAEYEKHVKIRNKHLAHLGRDIPLTDGEHQSLLPDNDFWMLASWMSKSFKIFTELLEICDMTSSYPIALSHDLVRQQIAEGTRPIAEQYSQIVKQRRGTLERITPRPSRSKSLANSHIAWRSEDGSMYYADKLQENKWHLYKKVSLGGINAKQVIAEGITTLNMKDTAEAVASGRGDPSKVMPLSFEAKSLAEMFRGAVSDAASPTDSIEVEILLAEMFRGAVSDAPEIQQCSAGLLIVSAEIEWDGYIGINTPVTILFVTQDNNTVQNLTEIARQLSEILRQSGVTVAIRTATKEEFAENLHLPPVMVARENTDRELSYFFFAGNPPENFPKKISLEGQTDRQATGEILVTMRTAIDCQ